MISPATRRLASPPTTSRSFSGAYPALVTTTNIPRSRTVISTAAVSPGTIGVDPAGQLLLDRRGRRRDREDHRIQGGTAGLERVYQAAHERVAGTDRVDHAHRYGRDPVDVAGVAERGTGGAGGHRGRP